MDGQMLYAERSIVHQATSTSFQFTNNTKQQDTTKQHLYSLLQTTILHQHNMTNYVQIKIIFSGNTGLDSRVTSLLLQH